MMFPTTVQDCQCDILSVKSAECINFMREHVHHPDCPRVPDGALAALRRRRHEAGVLASPPDAGLDEETEPDTFRRGFLWGALSVGVVVVLVVGLLEGVVR